MFDEIVCKKLSVIDEEGNKAIELSTSSEAGRHIFLYNKKEELRMSLVVEEVFGSTVVMPEKGGGLGIVLSAIELGSSISLRKGNGRLELFVDDDEISHVATYGKFGGAYLKSGPGRESRSSLLRW